MQTNWPAEIVCAELRKNNQPLGWRNKLYLFLASPSSSSNAQRFAFFVLLLSISSVLTSGIESTRASSRIAFMLTTVNQMSGGDHGATLQMLSNRTLAAQLGASSDGGWRAWDTWTLSMLGFFTFELLLRLVSYKNPFHDPMMLIDVLCIVPFVLNTVISHSERFHLTGNLVELYLHNRPLAVALHLVASLSALRFLKLIRFFIGTRILRETLYESISALLLPSYLALMLIIFFGSIIFAVEYDPADPDHMPDVTTSWWMLLVTMTTVGYGDYSPRTSSGRILISICMLAGLVIIAMPIAIVGNNFTNAWDRRGLTYLSEMLRQQLLLSGQSPDDVIFAFRMFDTNRSGYISYREFREHIQNNLRADFSPKEIRTLWKLIDADESGEVKLSEFSNAVFPEVEIHDLSEMLDAASTKIERDSGGDGRAPTAQQLKEIKASLKRDSDENLLDTSVQVTDMSEHSRRTIAPTKGDPHERMERLEQMLQLVLEQQQLMATQVSALLKATPDADVTIGPRNSQVDL